jgi:hypothetical protein
MEFDLPCECRKVHRVSIGLAGTSIPCECGRQLAVPSSLKLREMAGLAPVEPEPELVIRGMINAGELPARHCILCGHEAALCHSILIECERQWSRTTDDTPRLPFLFGGLLAYALRSSSRGPTTEVFGRDVHVPAPLSTCHACAADVAPRRVGILWRGAAWICLLAGAVLLVTQRIMPALWLLVAAAVLMVVARWRRAAEQSRLRALLRRMPEYDDLFQKYPRATIQF